MKQMSCANCNATLTYEENDKVVTCNFCGTICDAKDRQIIEVELPEKTFMDVNKFFCNGCETKFISDINTTPPKCAYCGSSLTIEAENYKAIKPEKILTFEIGLDEAKEKARKYFENSAFEHKELAIDSLYPVYLPYWMYDCTCEAEYEYSVGRAGDERHYLKKIKAECQGILADASKIENYLTDGADVYFDLSKLKDFYVSYIDKYYVEDSNIEFNSLYFRLNNKLEENVIENQLGMPYFARNKKINISNEKATYIYLPFYYADVEGLKVLVNGQTGNISINSKDYLKTGKQLEFEKILYGDIVQKNAKLIGILGAILFLLIVIKFSNVASIFVYTAIILFVGYIFISLRQRELTLSKQYSNVKKIIYQKKKRLYIWDMLFKK